MSSTCWAMLPWSEASWNRCFLLLTLSWAFLFCFGALPDACGCDGEVVDLCGSLSSAVVGSGVGFLSLSSPLSRICYHRRHACNYYLHSHSYVRGDDHRRHTSLFYYYHFQGFVPRYCQRHNASVCKGMLFTWKRDLTNQVYLMLALAGWRRMVVFFFCFLSLLTCRLTGLHWHIGFIRVHNIWWNEFIMH